MNEVPLPVQLTPVVLLGGYDATFDAVAHLRRCYAALGFDSAASTVPAQLNVPDPSHAATQLPPGAQAPLLRDAKVLLGAFQTRWTPAVGTVTGVQITALTADQRSFAKGTVVVTRSTDQVIEQYVLPCLSVDFSTGRHQVVGLEGLHARPAPHQRAAPMVSGRSGTKNVLSFFLAETPFLPPPAGAIGTGLLTLFNLLLDTTAADPPNPYTELKADIEHYLDLLDLKDNGQVPLDEVCKELSDDIGSLKGTPGSTGDDFSLSINDLTTIPPPLRTLWAYIDGDLYEDTENGDQPVALNGYGWHEMTKALSFLWDTLQPCDDTNGKDILQLLLRAVTVQLMLAKLSVQARALACNIHQKNNNATAFDAQTAIWNDQVRRIAISLGVDPATGQVPAKWMVDFDSWSADLITDGLHASGWIPRIRAWYASVRAKRLATANISALYKVDLPVDGQPAVDEADGGQLLMIGCWTWTDQRLKDAVSYFGSPDFGEWSNRTCDTTEGFCCGTEIEHKDVAQQAWTAYVAKVKSDLDAFADRLQTVDAWATYIADFHAILPPAKPASGLRVTAPATGAASAATGTWQKGSILRYRVAGANTDHGPGPAGDPSPDYSVGDVLGAVIGNLPTPDGADALWLYRQTRTSGQKWTEADDASIVAIIAKDASTKAFPATYTDTSE